MPEASKKIQKYLDIDTSKWEEIEVKEEIKLDNLEPLFERIK